MIFMNLHILSLEVGIIFHDVFNEFTYYTFKFRYKTFYYH